jgi:hypothetical protein
MAYMSPQEQTDAFEADLEALVRRYRGEFDMNLPAIVGVLYMFASYVGLEAVGALAEEEEEYDEDEDGDGGELVESD